MPRHKGKHNKGKGKKEQWRKNHGKGKGGRHHGRGGHKGRRGHHGPKHMKACLIAGAIIYQVMTLAFVVIFKRFVWAFGSYQYLNKLKAESA